MTVVATSFCVLLFLGIPIGIAVGAVGLIGLAQMGGERFLAMSAPRFFAGLNEFTFLAIPFFVLAGELMNRSGITERLIDLARSVVGHLRGGLAQTNMLTSVLFAGMSGTATADAAAFGTTLVPQMRREGYLGAYATAVTAAGSVIGPTIPPSNLMVLYGAMMSTSIGGLFAAGIVPGVLICALGMFIIGLQARGPNFPATSTWAGVGAVCSATMRAVLPLMMPVIILVGMVAGVATPTEVAAIAVLWALLIGALVYRRLNYQSLIEAAIQTARITGILFLILGTASVLGWWLAFNRIPQELSLFLLEFAGDRDAAIACVLLLLLIAGTLMDIIAILVILVPVVEPVFVQLGFEPIHAGIVVLLALNISLLTPPIGACLFILSSVTGEKILAICRYLWPFLLADFVVLTAFAYSESLAMFLPRLLGFGSVP